MEGGRKDYAEVKEIIKKHFERGMSKDEVSLQNYQSSTRLPGETIRILANRLKLIVNNAFSNETEEQKNVLIRMKLEEKLTPSIRSQYNISKASLVSPNLETLIKIMEQLESSVEFVSQSYNFSTPPPET